MSSGRESPVPSGGQHLGVLSAHDSLPRRPGRWLPVLLVTTRPSRHLSVHVTAASCCICPRNRSRGGLWPRRQKHTHAACRHGSRGRRRWVTAAGLCSPRAGRGPQGGWDKVTASEQLTTGVSPLSVRDTSGVTSRSPAASHLPERSCAAWGSGGDGRRRWGPRVTDKGARSRAGAELLRAPPSNAEDSDFPCRGNFSLFFFYNLSSRWRKEREHSQTRALGTAPRTAPRTAVKQGPAQQKKRTGLFPVIFLVSRGKPHAGPRRPHARCVPQACCVPRSRPRCHGAWRAP